MRKDGIEINSDLCSLQRAMVEKHGLKYRIQVLEGDMCGMGETIRTGDVVILNNVFDWFMAPEVQVMMMIVIMLVMMNIMMMII